MQSIAQHHQSIAVCRRRIHCHSELVHHHHHHTKSNHIFIGKKANAHAHIQTYLLVEFCWIWNRSRNFCYHYERKLAITFTIPCHFHRWICCRRNANTRRHEDCFLAAMCVSKCIYMSSQTNERKEDMYISSGGEHFCLHVKAIYTVSFPFLFDFRWVFRFLSKGSVRINQKVQQTAATKILTHNVFNSIRGRADAYIYVDNIFFRRMEYNWVHFCMHNLQIKTTNRILWTQRCLHLRFYFWCSWAAMHVWANQIRLEM